MVATTGLLGGCSGSDSPSTPRGEAGGSPSPTATESLRRRVTLVETDDIADQDLSVEVTLLSKQVDNASPAKFEIRTTNTGPPRRLKIQASASCCLFNRGHQGSHPQGLTLHHRNRIPEEKHENRWEEDRTPREGGFADYGCPTPIYEQGESVTNEYELWDDYENPGYYPTGTYRFEAPIEIREADDSGESKRLAEVTWGFSIDVTMAE
jgi:hypothetical protein